MRPDARRYRVDAACLHRKALATVDDLQLRDSYLDLAREYEGLADILENGSASSLMPPKSSGTRGSISAKLGKYAAQWLIALRLLGVRPSFGPARGSERCQSPA